MTPTVTLFWDQADSRWKLIVMKKPFVKNYKLPRTIVTEEQAKEHIATMQVAI